MRAAIVRTLSLFACLVGNGVGADSARIGVDSPSVAEGDGPGTATLDFTVTRSGEIDSTVALRYRTDDDTAVAPGDYVAVPPSTLVLGPGQADAIVPVTINGDAGVEGDETMFLHLTSILSYAAARTFPAGDGAAAVAPLDVNGDGRPDLVVANSGGDSVSVLLNTTAPGAGAASYAMASEFGASGKPVAVDAADVNGDDLADLVVASSDGDSVSVLLNTTVPGADAPSYAIAGEFAAGSKPSAVIAIDVNGDARPDLIVANSGGDSVSVLLNATAPGADAPSYAVASEFAAGSTPVAIGVIDVNGDNRPDLVVANNGSDSISVLLNTTVPFADTASFGAAGDFAAGNGPRSIVAADVDGDGRADLAVANSDSVAVLFNATAPGAADAAFADASGFAADNSPRSLATTDIDDDGRPDLVVANDDGDSVSVLLNTTAPGVVASYTAAGDFAAGSAPRSIATTDGDGDGRTLKDDDDDRAPDAFRFEDRTGVELESVITSAAITVSGIDTAVRIEVSGGRYSVGCTTSFRSGSSTVTNGQTVCARHTSSEDFDTATDTVLTIGGVADTFTSVTLGADTTPDAFAFTDVDHALLNSPQVSDSVTIRGIRSAAPVSVTGGDYSLGCTGTFTAAASTIAPDSAVCVRHTSSAIHGTAADTTLTVGGVSDTFRSTTSAAQDFSQTGAPAPLDVLLGLLAFGIARRRRTTKIRSPGCPGERIT